jgi:hypothetical protein
VVTRVTGAELKELVATSKTEQVLEDNFIDTAHQFIEANLLGAGHSEAILKKIELYLAAHFLALTEELGGLVRDTMGDSAQSMANVYKAGLRSTRFGQVALDLDTSGTLARLATSMLRAELRIV